MNPFTPEHPKFDLAMELLCLLPKRPCSAFATDLATQLRMGKRTGFKKLLVRNKEVFKVGIVSELACGVMTYGIQRLAWRRAKRLTEEYWSVVYGEAEIRANFVHRHERLKS